MRHELAEVREELAAAVHHLAALEAKKTSPSRVAKANRPERTKTLRRKRAAEQSHARRREQPTDTVDHQHTRCPDYGSRLGGVRVARRRLMVDLLSPAGVIVMEHQAQKGWCSACRKWHEARLDLSGVVLGQGRLGVRVLALVAHLRTALRSPIRSTQR